MRISELIQLVARLQSNGWVTPARLAQAAGIPAKHASGYLYRGYRAGLLERKLLDKLPGMGKRCYGYMLSQAGKEYLQRIQESESKSLLQLVLGLLLALIKLLRGSKS